MQGVNCGLELTVLHEREGESGLFISSFWELVESEGLVGESTEDTEEELLCIPHLLFEEVDVLRILTEPFPLDSPFCFVVCAKPLCFFDVFPSFLCSKVDGAGMQCVEGVVDAVWSAVEEQDLCPAESVWPLTIGSFSFFTLSDEPFKFTSALSASLIET